MYRVRCYPFVFIENQVGKMVVIIAGMMMQPYLAGSWRRWLSFPPMAIAESGRCYGVSQRQHDSLW